MIVTDAIEKFTQLVKRAAQAHSKDLRIDLADATALLSELANITARLARHELAEPHEASKSGMDGGKF